MTRTDKQSDPCTYFEERIHCDASELSAEERAFMAAHRRECDLCDTEGMVVGLFSHRGEPIPPLDDIARRSMIHSVVDRLESEGEHEGTEPAPEATPEPQRRNLFWGRKVAIAAAITAIIAGALLLAKMQRSEVTAPGAAPVSLKGRVMMTSGGARDGFAKGVGAELGVGDRVGTGDGRGLILLPSRTWLVLEKKSIGAVSMLSENAVSFNLTSGKVLASVSRAPTDPVFSIGTPRGRVIVTGTLFSVEVTPERVQVAVLHGRVKVEQPGHRLIYVAAKESYTMGTPGVTAMRNEQSEWCQDGVRLIQMVDPRNNATLVAHSTPGAARVFVDGTFMGVTPLVSQLRAGYRKVSIQKDGFSAVKQVVELKRGTEQQLSVHLKAQLISGGTIVQPTRKQAHVPLTPARPSRLTRKRPLTKPAAPVSPVPTKSMVAPPAVVSSLSAGQLLKQARRFRAQRNWDGAVQAYEQLIKGFPASAQASLSRVTLGMIYLDHKNNAARALLLFTQYLRGGGQGILAQEAAWGEIRALKALGRTRRERLAIIAFLKRWPGAIQGVQARHRLSVLHKL